MFDINKIIEGVKKDYESLPSVTETVSTQYFNSGDYEIKLLPYKDLICFDIVKYTMLNKSKSCVGGDENIEQLLSIVPELTKTVESYVPCLLFNIASDYSSHNGVPEVNLISSNNKDFKNSFIKEVYKIISTESEIFIKTSELDSPNVLRVSVAKYATNPVTKITPIISNNPSFINGVLNQDVKNTLLNYEEKINNTLTNLSSDNLTEFLMNNVIPRLKGQGLLQ